MNIFSTIGSCLGDTVQAIIEKNRIKAQVNRLRLVMRSETKTINKAYIELGKEYYKKLKCGEQEGSAETQELCASIVKANERFKRAIARYHELIDTQVIAGDRQLDPDEEESEGGDITLCCSYDEQNDTADKSEPAEPAEETEPEKPQEQEPAKESDDESVFSGDDQQAERNKLEDLTDISSGGIID